MCWRIGWVFEQEGAAEQRRLVPACCCRAARPAPTHTLLPTIPLPSLSPSSCSWNAGKKFMGKVEAFLKSLLNFDKDNIPGG